MMEFAEMSEAVRDGFLAAHEEIKEKHPARRMMRINEFAAFNDEGRSVQVVGVLDDDDMMKFIVIIEDADGDGEVYPIVEHSVFKQPPQAT